METTEIAIVGAGPVGIELAIALKRRGLSYRHFEAEQVGATVQWYAPGTTFFSSSERIELAGVPFDVPNQQKATREQYLAYLRTLVREFDLRIETYTRVEEISRSDGAFRLNIRRSLAPGSAATSSTVIARKVVLVIGDMHRPRLLGIPGEDLPHVSHYFEDPHRYFGTRVLIVGGKNSAAEAAIRLYRLGVDVSISYRKPAFDEKRVKGWILPELKYLIINRAIGFHPSSTPVAITPDAVTLRSTNGKGGETRVPADFVLLLTGYEQDPTLFSQCGIELLGEGRKPKYDPGTMMTNVPGLYVAGTGAAGTQIGGVTEFIETSHVHVSRIAASLAGETTPPEDALRSEDLLET